MNIFVDLDGTFFKIDTTKYLFKYLSFKNKLIFIGKLILNKRAQAKYFIAKKVDLHKTDFDQKISADVDMFMLRQNMLRQNVVQDAMQDNVENSKQKLQKNIQKNIRKNSRSNLRKNLQNFHFINPIILNKLWKMRRNSSLILATGANNKIASYIVNIINKRMHFHNQSCFFLRSIASTHRVNAIGRTKLRLVKSFARLKMKGRARKTNIVYFGNSFQDINVCIASDKSFLITQNFLLIKIVEFMNKVRLKKINLIK